MKAKIMWSGAVLTVFVVIGIWFFRQLKKTLGFISLALSNRSIQAYVT